MADRSLFHINIFMASCLHAQSSCGETAAARPASRHRFLIWVFESRCKKKTSRREGASEQRAGEEREEDMGTEEGSGQDGEYARRRAEKRVSGGGGEKRRGHDSRGQESTRGGRK